MILDKKVKVNKSPCQDRAENDNLRLFILHTTAPCCLGKLMHGFSSKNVRNLCANPPIKIDKLFVVFLITLLAFQCHLLKKVRSISGLCLARDCTFFDTIRFNMIVHSLTQSIRFLTFFDTIRFCRSLALLNGRTESNSKIKIERQLFSLRRDRFGNALSDTTRHFLNLLDYVLSDTESFVLSHGLNFGLPIVQRRILRRI